MLRATKRLIDNRRRNAQAPLVAKAEMRRDRLGLSDGDPGPEVAMRAGIAWLCRAQDESTSADGGVARHYSLVSGWSSSYPETTGYIVPTMLKYARLSNDEELRKRARSMLDWLVSLQFAGGGFPGGVVGTKRQVVPVVFNTGQILLGLAAGVEEFGDRYRQPMNRAARWLVQVQDRDGCWRKGSSPFVKPGEKTYDVHVAWALLEAARFAEDSSFVDCAMRNVDWAMTHQQENGWFDKCCLKKPAAPLTHTLGYALRGLLEAYLHTQEERCLVATQRLADSLIAVIREDGYLAGRWTADWKPAVSWVCLTGTSQIAYCWLVLWRLTRDRRYLDSALLANKYVRRTISMDGNADTRGAVKGSFPVNGGYNPFEYLNWACKFTIDSNLMESEVLRENHEQ